MSGTVELCARQFVNKKAFVFSRYDPKENKWGKVAPMTTRRLGVAVAVLGGYLYAIGGSDGQCPLNTGICRPFSRFR